MIRGVRSRETSDSARSKRISRPGKCTAKTSESWILNDCAVDGEGDDIDGGSSGGGGGGGNRGLEQD